MPDQLLTPADVEQAIIDELSSAYIVSTSIPENKPNIFVRIIAGGGRKRDLVTDSPVVVVEVFAKLESAARNAAADIVARLELAARKGQLGTETCYGLEIAGVPQNYPLPNVPTHKRYVTTIAPALRRRVNPDFVSGTSGGYGLGGYGL